MMDEVHQLVICFFAYFRADNGELFVFTVISGGNLVAGCFLASGNRRGDIVGVSSRSVMKYPHFKFHKENLLMM